MLRLPRLAPLLLLACVAGCSFGERPRPGTPPRAVLLLTVEGLRADHVTYLAYPRQTTHVRKESAELVLDIDRMAQTGVTFVNAFSPSPAARPALVSLMTGLQPPESGVFAPEDALPADVATLAEDFSAAGFTTAAFVGAAPDAPRLGADLARGFGTARELADDVAVLKEAVTWLKQAPTDGPLFVWVHLGELREPFAQAPLEDYVSAPASDAPLELAPEVLADPAAGAPARRRLVDRYDGGVARANLLLHAFLENYRYGFLADELFEESVVFVCGTNGVLLGERDGATGASDAPCEETLRVPLVFRHPPSLTGRRLLDEPVTLADVAPTLREWFALDGPGRASGRSLLALTDSYERKPFTSRPAAAWSAAGGAARACSLRDERWRATFAGDDATLFDLARDPHATDDLAPREPQAVDAWRARLADAAGDAR
ncbi:MAG: sulfatase-like hydrolase/transferase [Planctomycetes bacterium]|nr:sulfatase-like hydrolase/transferase [Planctomycetota bacterium]